MELRRFSIEALPRPAKQLLKSMIPKNLLNRRRRRKLNSYAGLTNREIFTSTYLNYLWGRKQGGFDFYSGDGSHDPNVINEYLSNVSNFLSQFDPSPVIVDIGCGDFHIGSKLSIYAKQYIACDVVPEVIAANVIRYELANVSFKVLDAATQDLPNGEIVILRQVLQHLSNRDIKSVLERIKGNFQYLIFTDHHPLDLDWVPNLDKQTGPNIRAELGSGLDLCKTPFDLNPIDSDLISEVRVGDGFIRTYIYTLR
jgi:hypothetical protein